MSKGAAVSADRWVSWSSSLGLALIGAIPCAEALSRGGLAVVVVAAAVGLALASPAAVAEWRAEPDPDPRVREAVRGFAELGGIAVTSSALAWIGRDSWPGLVGALLAWPIGAWLARAPRWLGAPAGIGAVGLAVTAGFRGALAPPWTLLRPEWTEWGAYAGPAALAGMAWAGLGTARWSLGPARPPGAWRTPVGVVGVGIAVGTALAVHRAAAFEASLGAGFGGAEADVWLALIGVSLAGATTGVARGMDAPRGARPLLGMALTAALAGPGYAVAPWMLGVALPASALVSTGARIARGARGWPEWTAVAVAAAALVGAWPGRPAQVADALWLGLLTVGGFWFVATRTLLARREA